MNNEKNENRNLNVFISYRSLFITQTSVSYCKRQKEVLHHPFSFRRVVLFHLRDDLHVASVPDAVKKQQRKDDVRTDYFCVSITQLYCGS